MESNDSPEIPDRGWWWVVVEVGERHQTSPASLRGSAPVTTACVSSLQLQITLGPSARGFNKKQKYNNKKKSPPR